MAKSFTHEHAREWLRENNLKNEKRIENAYYFFSSFSGSTAEPVRTVRKTPMTIDATANNESPIIA